MNRRSLRALTLGTTLLALAACSSPSPHAARVQASPSPSASSAGPTPTSGASPSASTPPQSPAFAVLENRKGDYPHGHYDRVAITRSDGNALAAVSFQPANANLQVCMAGAVPPPVPGYVISSRAYFLDGSGAVRWLDGTGAQGKLAQFSLAPTQQELSFAVSPDGSQVVAARLTLPQVLPGSGQDPCSSSGPVRLELIRSSAAGEQAVWSSTSSTGLENVQLVGWDATGPVALVGNTMATQNAWIMDQRIYGGHLAHLDSGLKPADTLTGPDCVPYGLVFTQPFACHPKSRGGKVTVVNLSGQTLMTANPLGELPGDYAPSSDGARLAMYGALWTRGSPAFRLADAFHPQGWLDDATVIGRLGDQYNATNNLALVRVASPSSAMDLGFAGDFLGVIG